MPVRRRSCWCPPCLQAAMIGHSALTSKCMTKGCARGVAGAGCYEFANKNCRAKQVACATHARPRLPAASASVPYGFVLVRVRVRVRVGAVKGSEPTAVPTSPVFAVGLFLARSTVALCGAIAVVISTCAVLSSKAPACLCLTRTSYSGQSVSYADRLMLVV